jgi:hypothetical protein
VRREEGGETDECEERGVERHWLHFGPTRLHSTTYRLHSDRYDPLTHPHGEKRHPTDIIWGEPVLNGKVYRGV